MVASSYARVYRTNAILTASPGQLVLLLFDGALSSLAAAREGFARPQSDLRRYEVINRQLNKAQRIITELRQALNFDNGGEFATLMLRLYEYYNRRLFEANVQKRVEPVIEVEQLLGDLRNAWSEMLRRPEGAPLPAAPAPRVPVLQE